MDKKTIKIKSSLLENLVSKVIKEEYREDRGSRYMFFSNLEQMSRQANMLLDMDKTKLENILEDGHDWAQDHIAEAKSLLDQVFDFIKNEVKGSDHEYYNNIVVGEGDTKKDACYHKVKSRYEVWPSAYASGALVQCREVGAENWGESKNEQKIIQKHNFILERKLTSKPSSETSLRDWFGRKGEKGSVGGWVDCNAPDGKGGYKSCGRKEGEERSKYPACRPTPSSCKEYKSTKGKSWGKKSSKNEQISENLKYHLDNRIPLTENVFRFGSEAYLNLLKETRSHYFKGKLRLNKEDEEFIMSDVGTKGIYEGKEVWLDVPFEYGDILSEAEYQGREVKLNHPMRNPEDGKKYMVYVKDPSSGNVRKITFGDKKGGLTAKLSDPEARKSFAARHKCSEKKDKTSSGYWACRLTKFGHLFNGKTYPGYW